MSGLPDIDEMRRRMQASSNVSAPSLEGGLPETSETDLRLKANNLASVEPNHAMKVFQLQSLTGLPAEVISADVKYIQDRVDQSETDLRLKANNLASVEPNHATKVLQLQGLTGLPAEAISADIDYIQDKVNQRDFDPEKYKDTPNWAKFAAKNPYNLSVLKDDEENLTALERAYKPIVWAYQHGEAQREMGRMSHRIRASETGEISEADKKRFEELRGFQADHDFNAPWFSKLFVWTAKQMPNVVGAVQSGIDNAVYTAPTGAAIGAMYGGSGGAAIGSVVPGAGTAAGGAVGASAGAVFGAATGFSIGMTTGIMEDVFVQEGGGAYMEYRHMGFDHEEAKWAGNTVGTVNAALEATGLGIILKTLPGASKLTGSIANRVVKDVLARPTARAAMREATVKFGGAMAGEITTEVFQELATTTGGEILKARNDRDDFMTLDEWSERVGDIVVETMKSTLLLAGAGPGMGLAYDGIRMRNAKKVEEAILALGEPSANSKMRKSVPKAFRDFVAMNTEDGPVKFALIDAKRFDTYWQSENIDPDEIADQLGVENLDVARETGGNVEIPLTEFGTKLVHTKHLQGMSKDIKFQESLNSVHEEEQLEAERNEKADNILAMAETMTDTSDKAKADAIIDEVISELVNAGVSPRSAQLQAQIARGIPNLAERMGMDPNELFKKVFGGVQATTAEALSAKNIDVTLDPMLDDLREGVQPTQKAMFGDSLVQFLKKKGRLAKDSGLDARDIGKSAPSLMGGTLSLDAAAEAAAEAGYIQTPYDQNILLNALDAEIGGELKYGHGTGDPALQEKAARMEQLSELLESAGLDVDTMSNQEIRDAFKNVQELEQAFNESGPVDGKTLFQVKRGAIEFDETGRGFIKLFKKRNASTFIHEMGHMYLNILGTLAKDKNAPEQIQKDYKTILEYLGVENADQIETKHHEKFARSWEKYAEEGKAPSMALRDAFIAFSKWMLQVYRNIRNKEQLTPEIRGVFDRILASDEEISIAEQAQELVPLFTNAQKVSMSKEVFEVYRRDTERAHAEGVEKVSKMMFAAKAKADKAWRSEEKQKVQAEVEAEAHQSKVYRALALLQKGKNPDGSALPDGVTAFKLDKASLLDLLDGSKAFLKRLPRPFIYTLQGGVDVHLSAQLLGYASPLEMLEEIANAPKMSSWIEAETEARMAERYPDPISDGTLAEESFDAVQNEGWLHVLIAELRELGKLAARDRKIVSATRRADARENRENREAASGYIPNKFELKVLKAATEIAVGKMQVRNTNPTKFLVSERKAGNAAFKHNGMGNYEQAALAKLEQIKSMLLYRATVKAQEDAAQAQRYLKKWGVKKNQAKIGRATNLLNQILAIVEGINFRKISLAKVDRESAQAELLERAGNNEFLNMPQSLIMRLADTGMNWQDMTVDELRGMYDLVKQLEHEAKQEEAGYLNDEQVKKDDAAMAIVTAIETEGKDPGFSTAKKTKRKAFGESISSGFHYVLRGGTIARILDGEGYGAVTQNIIVPVRRAIAEKFIPDVHRMQKDMASLYKKHYTAKELGDLSKPRHLVPEHNSTYAKTDLLAMLMNWGNKGNRRAVLAGLFPEDMGGNQRPAYTEQGVRAMFSHLDKRDAQFVQDVWDYIDTYWPELKKSSIRRRGLAPEKIVSDPFEIVTKDGEVVVLRGGYFPLKYNRDLSNQSDKEAKLQERKDAYNTFLNLGTLSTTTRAGATHDRTNQAGLVVRLDLNIIDSHLREVIRDISIGDEINFVYHLLKRQDIKNAFAKTGNLDTLKQLNLWLADTAVGELMAEGLWEHTASWSRIGFTKSKMAWNLVTTGLQILGGFQSAVVVGKRNYLRGVALTMRHPIDTYKHVLKTSKFMSSRYSVNAWDKDVSDTKNYLTQTFGPIPTRLKTGADFIGSTFFVPIMAMQSAVDVTTWMAGYHKGINDKGLSHEDSIYYADSVVENSQTSGFFSDRSSFERGTTGSNNRQSQFMRLWSVLMSYQIAKMNIAYEKGRKVSNIKEGLSFFGDLLFLYTIEAIAAEAIRGNFMKLFSDDDDDITPLSLAKGSAAVTLDAIVAGVPLAREIPAARFGGGTTPLGAVATDSVKAGQQIWQGELDQGLRRSIITFLGPTTHVVPSTQLNRWIDAWEDEESNPFDYITGPKRD